MKAIRRKRKGFTLIELIVVVTILGILMAIAVGRFRNMSDNANLKAFQANHKLVVSAVTMYVADHNGALPAAGETFDDYISSPDNGGQGIASIQKKPASKSGKETKYTWDGSKVVSEYYPVSPVTLPGAATPTDEVKLEYVP